MDWLDIYLASSQKRIFSDGLIIPMDETGAELCHSAVSHNAQEQMTWVHSYVSEDKQKT